MASWSQTDYPHTIAYKIKGSGQQGGLMALLCNEGVHPLPCLLLFNIVQKDSSKHLLKLQSQLHST